MEKNDVGYKRSPKSRGEYGELQFVLKAMEEGFAVSIPWGDSLAYDFILDSGRRLTRVQVKAGFAKCRGSYQVHGRRDNGKNYRPWEIDALVAFVAPENAWYVFPVGELTTKSHISLFPHRPNTRSKFEKYREAWWLLRSKSVSAGDSNSGLP